MYVREFEQILSIEEQSLRYSDLNIARFNDEKRSSFQHSVDEIDKKKVVIPKLPVSQA